MKYLKYLVIIGFLAGFNFMIGCGDDGGNGPTPEQEQLEKLAFTWTISSATLDGADRSADWANFKLTITGTKTYSTTNTGDENVWPTSGSWDFAGTEGAGLQTINRSDGISIVIDNISGTNLDLAFTYALAAPLKEGRVASIEGNWVFKFTNPQ